MNIGFSRRLEAHRVFFFLSVAACLMFWLLPSPKASAVLGRLDFLQFYAAVFSTCVALSAAAVTAAPPRRRRKVTMWVVMLWIGAAVPLAMAEAFSLLMPARHLMDNPFYVATSEGLKASNDLPFERPSHIRWEGLSRGDLALFHGDEDPYAEQITFYTDHQGFRNSVDNVKADIIFLGDSFTEAGSVQEEQTFVRIAAAGMNATARNLGRAGYSVPEELTVLQKYGLDAEPRAVVWQVTERNDLEEAVRYQEWRESGKPFFKIADAGSFADRKAWRKRSPAYRLYKILREQPPWPLQGVFHDAGGTAHPVRFLPVLPGREQSPAGHAGWPLVAGALREGQRMLRERGIGLTVLYIPMKFRVLREHVAFGEEAAARIEGLRDLPGDATLAHYLRRLCDNLQVPFLDMTPHFTRAASEGRLPYLPFDTHLSKEGHDLVGTLLAEHLPGVMPPAQR